MTTARPETAEEWDQYIESERETLREIERRFNNGLGLHPKFFPWVHSILKNDLSDKKQLLATQLALNLAIEVMKDLEEQIDDLKSGKTEDEPLGWIIFDTASNGFLSTAPFETLEAAQEHLREEFRAEYHKDFTIIPIKPIKGEAVTE